MDYDLWAKTMTVGVGVAGAAYGVYRAEKKNWVTWNYLTLVVLLTFGALYFQSKQTEKSDREKRAAIESQKDTKAQLDQTQIKLDDSQKLVQAAKDWSGDCNSRIDASIGDC